MCKLQHITIITGQDGNMGPIWSHLILICYIVLLVNIIMLLAFLVYINLEDTAIMWGKIYISPYVFLKFGHFHTALICLLFTNRFEANMLPKSTLGFPNLEYLNKFIYKLEQGYLPCLRILAHFMIATKETHLNVRRAHLDHNSKFVFCTKYFIEILLFASASHAP